MKSRLLVLKRIEAVYTLVEEMHTLQLRRAAAKVFEAERAIGEQRTQADGAADGTRASLLEGDREQRFVSQIQHEVSRQRQLQLDAVRLEREIASSAARDEYGASRIRREQMKSIVERSKGAAETAMAKRTQAAADDRFLSRLRWNQGRWSGERAEVR